MDVIDNTVRRVFSGQNVVSLTPKHTIREAAVVLSSHNIGAAPILEEEQLVGILSERDILQRVVATGRQPDTVLVADVMTRSPQTVSMEASLVEALSLMIAAKFRHLPVLDQHGHVIGMLSMRDIPLANHIMHQNWTTWTDGRFVEASKTDAGSASHCIQFDGRRAS
jgi:CBS domain-containing protein